MRIAPFMPVEIGRAAILFPNAPVSLRGLQVGRVDEAAGLAPPERGIVAAQPQQFVVRALLDRGRLMASIGTDKP